MASSSRSAADAAYNRALAAYDEKAYDAARRSALDAVRFDPQHAGARALLERLDAGRGAAPFQPAPGGRAGTTRNAPEAVSTDPTILISRASGPAPSEPVDPTVLINRDDFMHRLTEPDAPPAAPPPRQPAGRTVSERTIIAPPRSRPASHGSKPAAGTGAGQSFWQRLRGRGNRSAPPSRQSPAARDRSAAGRTRWTWTPGSRGALIALAAVAVGSLFVWGAIRASRWLFPAGQALTLSRPVGGTILGPGLRCGTRGTDCSTTRPTGEAVELEAQHDEGYVFSGFTGDCAPAGRTSMSEARTCGARFDPVAETNAPAVTFPLTITVPTGGTVLGAGDILCGTLGQNCSAQVPSGESVTLHFQADSGFAFSQFTGDCAPKGETIMTSARTCGATFVPSPLANVAPTGPVGPPERIRSRTPITVPPPRAQTAPPSDQAAQGQQGQPAQAASPVPTSPPTASQGPAASAVPTTPDKPAAPPMTAEDHAKNEIQQLVKNYCLEYETLKPDRIQKLFPLVNQAVLRGQFKEYKSLKCTVKLPPEFERLDASPAGGAQIKFEMKQVIQMKSNGAPETVETLVTMVVSRTDLRSPWLIDRVQHEAKPKP